MKMVHLLEPAHNARFISLMDKCMPRWQHYRQLLKRLQFRNDHWEY